MNADDTFGIEQLTEEPKLPSGFVGGFERVTNLRSGDCQTALYVFFLTEGGKKAYVGTFYGAFPSHATRAFREWLAVQNDLNAASRPF